jgi:hypothetical protein
VKLPEECGYAIVYARLLVQNLRSRCAFFSRHFSTASLIRCECSTVDMGIAYAIGLEGAQSRLVYRIFATMHGTYSA